MSRTALARFVDDACAGTSAATGGTSLVVVNRTEPEPVQRMLDSLFDGQPVSVDESAVDDADDDVVVLVKDDELVATSPLAALERSLLLVNSDRYITGAQRVGTVDPPDVILGLRDTPFRVRGYPASNSEKLPMILVSRYVERLAIDGGSGRLRAAFQRLSRIEDERGTLAVYERLADTDVDVHLYGV
ncbi:histidine kinase, partial [Halobium palmae]